MEIGSDTEGTSVDVEPFVKLNDKGGETDEKEGNENGVECQQNNKEIVDVRLDDNKLIDSYSDESRKNVELKIIEDSDIIGQEDSQDQHDEKKDSLIEDVVNCRNEHELNGQEKDDPSESCDKESLIGVTDDSVGNVKDIKEDGGDTSKCKSEESAEGVNLEEETTDKTTADTESNQNPEHDACEEPCGSGDQGKEQEMGIDVDDKVKAETQTDSVETDTKKADSSDINNDCHHYAHDGLAETIPLDAGETSADIDESDIIAMSSELTCDKETSNEPNQNKEQSATAISDQKMESSDVISCDEKVKEVDNETDSANSTGEETNTSMSAGKCASSLNVEPEDSGSTFKLEAHNGLFDNDDEVFDDNDLDDDLDLVEEHEPEKQAEVDSFISSVCEEMVQGMINAEVDFSTSDKTPDHGQGTVEEAEVLKNASGDCCEQQSEEAASQEHEAFQEYAKEAECEKMSAKSTTQDNKSLDDANGDLHAKQSEESAELDKDISDSGDVATEQCEGNLTSSGATEKDLQNEKLRGENMVLRGELESARAQLHTAQSRARDQQASHNTAVMALKVRLYQSQTEVAQQRGRAERQLGEVMSHLVLLEGRLKREQCRVRREVHVKDQVIQGQNMEILKLREQNDQLLNAIKEIYAKGGMNGYMREKKKGGSGSDGSDSGKNSKDKKVHNGKLTTVKDKFSWKNRSSLELNTVDLEKYLIKNERLYSSHEDLHNPGGGGGRTPAHFPDTHASSPSATGSKTHKHKHPTTPAFHSNGDPNKKSPRNSQNFFYDEYSPKQELSSSISESSQLSEQSSTSGFQSLSDQDLSNHDGSMVSNTNGNNGYSNDDDDDHYFSFSSTRINTVIDEEDSPGGQMMYMGSMPLLANLPDEQMQRLRSHKDRPHSLSSVDLISIQQQADSLAHTHTYPDDIQPEMSTPPPSPSQPGGQNKSELTPFQTFKTMFKRKGSKNKNHKKRSVSLSQTTNMEYKEAMNKHFQKYDMS